MASSNNHQVDAPSQGRALTVPLRDLTGTDRAHAGGKAATLGELSKAGFRVPDGFVVTTAAFERFLAHNALVSDYTPAQVQAAVLPDDVAAAIALAAAPYITQGALLGLIASMVTLAAVRSRFGARRRSSVDKGR